MSSFKINTIDRTYIEKTNSIKLMPTEGLVKGGNDTNPGYDGKVEIARGTQNQLDGCH